MGVVGLLLLEFSMHFSGPKLTNGGLSVDQSIFNV